MSTNKNNPKVTIPLQPTGLGALSSLFVPTDRSSMMSSPQNKLHSEMMHGHEKGSSQGSSGANPQNPQSASNSMFATKINSATPAALSNTVLTASLSRYPTISKRNNQSYPQGLLNKQCIQKLLTKVSLGDGYNQVQLQTKKMEEKKQRMHGKYVSKLLPMATLFRDAKPIDDDQFLELLEDFHSIKKVLKKRYNNIDEIKFRKQQKRKTNEPPQQAAPKSPGVARSKTLSAKASQIVDNISAHRKKSDDLSLRSDVMDSARGVSDKDARPATLQSKQRFKSKVQPMSGEVNVLSHFNQQQLTDSDYIEEEWEFTDNAEKIQQAIEKAKLDQIKNNEKRYKRQYCHKSLNQFELGNQKSSHLSKLRHLCIDIIEWKWFDRIVILLISLNSILLGLMDYTWTPNSGEEMPLINRITDESEILFTIFFTFEASVKIIAMGFILGNTCYLRDGWNWLDLTVVVTALMENLSDMENVSALRTFRLFRPLRSLSAIPSMKLLMNTLMSSVSQLSNILILDQFFILTFAIFGLQMWEGVIHYRCRQTKYPEDGDWKVVEDDHRLCGSFHQCEVACGSLYELTLEDEDGVMKEYHIDESIPLDRDSLEKSRNFGITNFDGIGEAYLTIFQCTTLEGWSEIMMMIQDSYNIYISTTFFIICVVICSFFLLNLTIAVMLDKFKQLNRDYAHEELCKYEKNTERVLTLKKVSAFMEKKKQISFTEKIVYGFRNVVYSPPGDPPVDDDQNKRYHWQICRLCWKIDKIPGFHSFIMLIILMNTMCLATDRYPTPEFDIIKSTNQTFNIIFLIECVIKLIGIKWDVWKEDTFNIFDLLIVIASFVEMVISDDSAGVIGALRALRLIRLIKLVRSNVTLRSLLDSIMLTIKAIGNFMVVLVIFIYVFSLLAMKVFAGQFKFDKEGKYDPVNGEIPRQNFDRIVWSFITVFQILIGEGWNEVMYKAYLSVSPSAVCFFIILVLLGKIIMLNLFLAIMLGNFEHASLVIRGQIEDQILQNYKSEQSQDMEGDLQIELRTSKKILKSQILSSDPSPTENRIPALQDFSIDEVKISPITKINESISANNDNFQLQPIQIANSPDTVFGQQQANSQLFTPNQMTVGKQSFHLAIKHDLHLAIEQAHMDMKSSPKSKEKSKMKEACCRLPKDKSYKDSSFNSSINTEQMKNLNQKKQVSLGSGEMFSEEMEDVDTKTHQQIVKFKKFNTYIEEKKSDSFGKNQKRSQLLENINNQDQIESHNQINDLQRDLLRIEMVQGADQNDNNVHHFSDDFGTDKKENHNFNAYKNNKNDHILITENFQHQNIDPPDTNRPMLEKNDNDNEIPQLRMNFGPSSNERKSAMESFKDDKKLKIDVQESNNQGQQDEQKPKKKSRNIVLDYMSKSSLFLFHQDSRVRQFMIKLTIPQMKRKVSKQESVLTQIQQEQPDDDSELEDEDQFNMGDPQKKGVEFKLEEKKEPQIQLKEEEKCPHAENEKNLKLLIRYLDSCTKVGDHILEDCDPQTHDQKTTAEKEINVLLNKLNPRIVGKYLQNLQVQGSNNEENEQHVKAKMMKLYGIMLKKQENSLKQRRSFRMKCKAKIQKVFSYIEKYLKNCFFCQWKLNQWFEYLIYTMILLSMIMLVLDDPLRDPKSSISHTKEQIDQFITCVFIVEAFCRITALGFIHSSLPGRKGYITQGSNQIDFFVCIVCDMIIWYNNNKVHSDLNPQTLKSFKVLRSLRALRPLRVINKNQGLRLAIGSLFRAMPAIANGMIICLLIVFIYAIIGVSLFKGLFFHCVFDGDEDEANLLPLVDTKDDCLALGGEWINTERNFDNIVSSLLSLFEIITTEGWMEVMYHGIDSRRIDEQPKENSSEYKALYFISFIIVGNIFILNLFVGVVIDKFNRLKDRMCGYSYMTRDQKDWVEQERLMLRIQLKPKREVPENSFQLIAFNMQKHRYFDYFIILCILINTIIMALSYYKMDEEYNYMLTVGSNLLTLIFNIEAIIKIVAEEQAYFGDSWNRFDFGIVVIADCSLLFELLVDLSDLKAVLAIMKGVMIMRVFRLIRAYKNLKVLASSLAVILPSIGNVGSLIMLMFFIFAVIGMNMFSGIIFQKEINENNNFTNFGMALVLLIRCATGEKWNIIMRELAVQNGDRSLPEGVECLTVQTWEDLILNGPRECGTQLAFAYFAAFILVIQMMMLNLFIAVVLEGFSSTNKEHTGVVTTDDLNELINIWQVYDPDATGFIDIKDLIFLVYELREPLGRQTEFQQEIKGQYEEAKRKDSNNEDKLIDNTKRFVVSEEKDMVIPFKVALSLLQDLDIPVYSENFGDYMVHFKDVCIKLTKLVFETKMPNFNPKGIDSKQQKLLNRAWIEKYPLLQKINKVNDYNSGRLWAALFIFNCIKNVCTYRKIQKQKDVQKKRQKPKSKANREKKNKQDQNQLESSCDGHDVDPLSPSSEDKFTALEKNKGMTTESAEKEVNPEVQSLRNYKNKQALEDDIEFQKYVENVIELTKLQNIYRNDPFQLKNKQISAEMEAYLKKLDIQIPVENHKITMYDEFNPAVTRDIQRSTWWMKDPEMNYKMAQWVKIQDAKEEAKKKLHEEKKQGELPKKQPATIKEEEKEVDHTAYLGSNTYFAKKGWK